MFFSDNSTASPSWLLDIIKKPWHNSDKNIVSNSLMSVTHSSAFFFFFSVFNPQESRHATVYCNHRTGYSANMKYLLTTQTTWQRTFKTYWHWADAAQRRQVNVRTIKWFNNKLWLLFVTQNKYHPHVSSRKSRRCRTVTESNPNPTWGNCNTLSNTSHTCVVLLLSVLIDEFYRNGQRMPAGYKGSAISMRPGCKTWLHACRRYSFVASGSRCAIWVEQWHDKGVAKGSWTQTVH